MMMPLPLLDVFALVQLDPGFAALYSVGQNQSVDVYGLSVKNAVVSTVFYFYVFNEVIPGTTRPSFNATPHLIFLRCSSCFETMPQPSLSLSLSRSLSFSRYLVFE